MLCCIICLSEPFFIYCRLQFDCLQINFEPFLRTRKKIISFLSFSFLLFISLTWGWPFSHNPVTWLLLFEADILIYAWHAALWALKAPVQATTMSSRYDKKQVAPLLLWFTGDARLQKSTWHRSARFTAVCTQIASVVSLGDHRPIPVWSIFLLVWEISAVWLQIDIFFDCFKRQSPSAPHKNLQAVFYY